jgi:S1-C subfamily serine protease
MMMKSLITMFLTVSCLCLPSFAQKLTSTLDKTISGVVTVAEYKVSSIAVRDSQGKVQELRLPKVRSAVDPYKDVLDLSGARGTGSGFVIERKGKKYIVTNAHVVACAADSSGALAAFTTDNTRHAVRLIGLDWFYDIAVLEFVKQPAASVSPLTFRMTPTKVGERVYAIGNPLGKYPSSVSDGIIGGRNRTGGLAQFGYLQSTATVIWGNSGGPLVDSSGKVVGINTRIEIQQRGKQAFIQPQLNFALDSLIASRIVDEILTFKRVRRGYLGIKVVQDTMTRTTSSGRTVAAAEPMDLTIVGTHEGSPARKALSGKLGQTLVSVNGKPVRDLQGVLRAFEQIRPGQVVRLELRQGKAGKTQQVTLTAGELTDAKLEMFAKDTFKQVGLEVRQENKGLSMCRVAGSKGSSPRTKGKSPVMQEDRTGPNSCTFRKLDYDEPKKEFKPHEPKAEAKGIVAVGRVAGSGKGSLWRVSTLADLGMACRLAGVSGKLDIVFAKGNKSFSVLQCNISGRDNLITKTLMY